MGGWGGGITNIPNRTGRVKEEGNEIIDCEKSPARYSLTVGIYIGLGTAGIIFALSFI